MNDYFDQKLAEKSDPANDKSPLEEDVPAADQPDVLAAAATAETLGTSAAVKGAIQELIKYGLVEKDAKPNLYRTLCQELSAVQTILEPFDFTLSLDEVRGIAFLKIPETAAENADEAWQHPLVRRQRLTNEQSLLVAILRQLFIAYEQTHGTGAAGAGVDLDELQTQFDLYLGDTGSEGRNKERLLRVITQLHAHGIVSEPDKENQVRIRPIIVHLANPEQLQLLLRHFKEIAKQDPGEAPPVTDTTDSDD